ERRVRDLVVDQLTLCRERQPREVVPVTEVPGGPDARGPPLLTQERVAAHRERLVGEAPEAAPLERADRRERQRLEGGVEHVRPSGLSGAQLEALDLAGRRLRQLGGELDPARILVGGDLVPDEGL